MPDGERILIAGVLLAVALAASLVAGRLRVPGLVLFLATGMVVGSWIDFDDYATAEAVGVLALALILFEGGLTAGWQEIRPVLVPSLSLAVFGTAITALVAGLAASWLFDFSTLEGLLLGSIIASTDGAAVFALLRGSSLRKRLARVLEGEAGFNDPVAVLLVLGFIEWIKHPDYGLTDLLVLFVQQMGIGLVAGVAVGSLAVAAFRRVHLATPGLYPVASLTAGIVAFGAADTLHGSGFLAVFICGLALGQRNIPARTTVAAFHEGLAWVGQLTMFLTLGLLVTRQELDDVVIEGTLLALIVLFVARPVATFISTVGMRFTLRETTLLSWAGLRGAVPVVLATFPVLEGTPHSGEFFNIVFFAVLLSTVRAGHDRRAAGAAPQGDDGRAGAAADAHRGGRGARAGGRRHRARHPAHRRGGRRTAARPGPASRRARVAHPARGGGAAAARLHTCRGLRPAADHRPARGGR